MLARPVARVMVSAVVVWPDVVAVAVVIVVDAVVGAGAAWLPCRPRLLSPREARPRDPSSRWSGVSKGAVWVVVWVVRAWVVRAWVVIVRVVSESARVQ